jgi:tRNA nucleotidyltransferase (CCA-adding enzyme)
MQLIHIPELVRLRDTFQKSGFDIRLVGGCVRDMLMGIQPKDIDLCTDATPDEQIALYKAAGVRFAETGLQHGTITVILPEGGVYEITSLRTETDHDGRHATVRYTRDWTEDLGRRDLTINAMAMTFEGQLLDPFGGQEDLKAHRLRFVNDPDQRMQEDYLRILRWLRFQGRIAPNQPLDLDTSAAAMRNAEGLKRISRERVWSEVSRMVATDGGPAMLKAMLSLGLAAPCGLPNGSLSELRRVHRYTRNAVVLMAAYIGNPDTMAALARAWKWSSDEAKLGAFLTKNCNRADLDYKRLIALHGVSKDAVLALSMLQDRRFEGEAAKMWNVPTFPLTGNDLIQAGLQPGKQLGEAKTSLMNLWADSGFSMTKDDLLGAMKQ